jgi:hypothetical protein
MRLNWGSSMNGIRFDTDCRRNGRTTQRLTHANESGRLLIPFPMRCVKSTLRGLESHPGKFSGMLATPAQICAEVQNQFR